MVLAERLRSDIPAMLVQSRNCGCFGAVLGPASFGEERSIRKGVVSKRMCGRERL